MPPWEHSINITALSCFRT